MLLAVELLGLHKGCCSLDSHSWVGEWVGGWLVLLVFWLVHWFGLLGSWSRDQFIGCLVGFLVSSWLLGWLGFFFNSFVWLIGWLVT
jgi:hypothetical protein